MGAAVLAIIGTIMQASASGEIACIYVGRFIAGLGVGAASMVTPLYGEYAWTSDGLYTTASRSRLFAMCVEEANFPPLHNYRRLLMLRRIFTNVRQSLRMLHELSVAP